MRWFRRSLLCAAILTTGTLAMAEDVKPVKLVPVIRAEKKVENEVDAKKKAQEDAKREQEELEKAQRVYEEQLKKAQAAAEKAATHKLLTEVKITGKGGNSLQTLGVDSEGRILALVAQHRGFSASSKTATSEVQILDQDGKKVDTLSVKFHANCVNAGADGTIYVAGDGKLARFGKDGKMKGEVVELPFIAELLKDSAKLKEKAEKQIKMQKDSFEKMVSQYKDRTKKLEEKAAAAKEKGEELTKSEAAQLKQFNQIVDSFKESAKYYDTMTVDSVVQSMLGRVRVISSVSANEKDLYIVCGESEGYGFGLWRMDLDLKNAKKITSNISGCCGQMDVQCCGEDIVVAENTKHRFARYDRDGKELASGGMRATEAELSGFGGCCNPMNVKACGGDILTAESEGIVKRFGPTGEFKGVVGAVKISGGCKNVAIGSNLDGSRVYFCDQPGGRVLILAKKDKAETK